MRCWTHYCRTLVHKSYTWYIPTQNFQRHFGTSHVSVWLWYILRLWYMARLAMVYGIYFVYTIARRVRDWYQNFAESFEWVYTRYTIYVVINHAYTIHIPWPGIYHIYDIRECHISGHGIRQVYSGYMTFSMSYIRYIPELCHLSPWNLILWCSTRIQRSCEYSHSDSPPQDIVTAHRGRWLWVSK